MPAWLSPQKLTKNQAAMLRWMCVLIVIQWMILFAVVQLIHRFLPDHASINLWAAILIPIVLLFIIYIPVYHPAMTVVRILAFLGLGMVMSYVLSAEYNITINAAADNDKDGVRRTFFVVWLGVIIFFAVVVGFLPLLLPHAPLLAILGVVLFIIVIGLLISLFFIPDSGRSFTVWLFVAVIVFTLLIITDTATVIIRCRQRNTPECDPVIGATNVYLDMINLLINSFRLANR